MIQWLYPQCPVIPQLTKCSTFIAWDMPAGTVQINNTTKDLALVGGIFARIVSHNVCQDIFRDHSNIKWPSNLLVSITTKEVTQITGHSAVSFLYGTTDKYVGKAGKDTYSRAL
jgi:hypothetical protein